MAEQLRDETGKPLGWSTPAHPPAMQDHQGERELPVSTDYRDNSKEPSKAVRFQDSEPDYEVKHEDVVRREEEQATSSSAHHFASYPSNGVDKLEDVSFGKSSPRTYLLYGTLELEIHQAKYLPNMDWFSQRINQCMSVFGTCQKLFVKATEKAGRHKITSDPYVVCSLGDATLAKTKVISNSQHPHWDEKFLMHVAHTVTEVVLTVKDNDVFGAQVIGTAKIPAEQVVSGPSITETWLDILGANEKPVKPGAQLKISLTYTPVEKDPNYRHGVGENGEVPRTYFKMRRGGEIKLYQDAHCKADQVATVELENGKKYEPGRCWEDICRAILEAHHMVYIAGWSVYDKVKLLRENNRDFSNDVVNLTLGELLKRKAAEGVRVLLLVWDDKTSHHNPLFTTEGVMDTHDEETKKYFRHSSVRCVLSARYGDSKLSWLKQRVVGTFYTHHQKLVIVDSQGHGNNRKLTAFIGGLDLAKGRYDTPNHTICSTLSTIHKEDYHNPTFSGPVESGGPREPWHDLHCKIEGQAAYDVLTNFEQRWKKSARWHTDDLIEIERISWILSPNQGEELLKVKPEDDPERWHVQVFRSIDSGSVKGFPKEPNEAQKHNLVSGKNVAIDMSIHTAYVERIRSAQHFIYIENQYFLGSSYAWPDYQKGGATHMIPMELALKIASKIRSRERFAVYVVIPMWPEGVPDSATVQEILYFQSQTIKMMYKIIAEALNDVGSGNHGNHPTDYLNFYCLGNRETRCDSPINGPPEKSAQWYAQKNKRFMIYVHSKGMIVDDEYVIIGSANINQRSMDGSRDTELAMGAYQPKYTWANKGRHPLGQIYGYRASLWSEHLGFFDNAIFRDPWELQCVRKVNEIAKKYWGEFVSEKPSDMKGHLMNYPIKVEVNGDIGPIPGYETFPDVGGKVLGQHSLNLPDNLTG